MPMQFKSKEEFAIYYIYNDHYETYIVYISNTEYESGILVAEFATEKEAQQMARTIKPQNQRACKVFFEV